MSINYKITYEHRDGDHTRSEEIFIESNVELTIHSEEVQTAVLRDSARFFKSGMAGFSVISVVPYP